VPLINPLPAETNSEVRALADFFNETLGFCPNSVLTMQVRPEIAKAFIQLNSAVMENHGRVSSSLKRLIGFVASRVAGCNYCQAHTIRAAERYHADDEQLAHIWDYKTHSAFSEAERTALDFAVAAATVPNGVDDEIRNRMHEFWKDGEIVEILGVVALFGFLNRWNDSMATTLESGAEESARKWLSGYGWDRGKHT
jgi:uncharacterized peroxidase-related enzyme